VTAGKDEASRWFNFQKAHRRRTSAFSLRDAPELLIPWPRE
jgi:hypothetical protein